MSSPSYVPALARALALLAALCALAGCSGAGNVGDACTRAGSTDHCVDGAICAQDEAEEGTPSDPQWDSFTCRAICASQDDCGAGLECRGVTAGPAGVRACQPFRTP